jgi:hypothetical protein
LINATFFMAQFCIMTLSSLNGASDWQVTCSDNSLRLVLSYFYALALLFLALVAKLIRFPKTLAQIGRLYGCCVLVQSS